MDFAQIFDREPRNARKFIGCIEKSRQVGGWVWDLANLRGGSVDFFLPACLERIFDFETREPRGHRPGIRNRIAGMSI
jgi:hypothetical protein